MTRPLSNAVLLFSGNLSQDYFTNRQDRYICFENTPEIADFYVEMIEAISDHICVPCRPTAENLKFVTEQIFPHPTKHRKKFTRYAHNLIEECLESYSQHRVYTKKCSSSAG